MMTPILILGIFLGTMTTMFSSSWFFAWLGLEINMMAIIPMMLYPLSQRSLESSMKYFISQAVASSTIILASSWNYFSSGQWVISFMSDNLAITLIILALLLKLGLAPLHFWLPEVLQGVSLHMGLIITTWQKLAPLTLLIQVSSNLNNMYILISISVMSVLIGGLGGLNQTQLRKLLAYSSISHMGWIVGVMAVSTTLSWVTTVVYLIINFSIFTILIELNSTKISDLMLSWSKTSWSHTKCILILLSLGGLPPFTGFFLKLSISNVLISNSLILMTILLMGGSLISLFFYLRLSFVTALLLAPTNLQIKGTWKSPHYSNLLFNLMFLFSILLLPLSPFMISLFQISW
uniref:NADH dehydrogenase subunit 2 n=1 Tax=Myxine fernholmi TaxID=1932030 RepID=UPI001EDE4EAB|nr:NADH dehydrogenase subunit 2 [Myxine fernholmi]UKB88176.1 NADH dehydrogenase subunit 2 [Myxine fernholmi]